jgi:hypothetical protein
MTDNAQCFSLLHLKTDALQRPEQPNIILFSTAYQATKHLRDCIAQATTPSSYTIRFADLLKFNHWHDILSTRMMMLARIALARLGL